jgi:cyclophilin family peptidyl-prolyl cis-trans isomerase
MEAEGFKHHIVVAGILNDQNFQQAKTCALYLERSYPADVKATVHQLFETQWEELLKGIKATKKGKFHYHKGAYIVYVNEDEYLGDYEGLETWALMNYRYSDNSNTIVYKRKAALEFKKSINDCKGRSYCFMEIRLGDDLPQRVLIELFTDIAPDSCENFAKLCGGTFTNKKGEKLTYQGTEFHRIVKGAFVQGGDLSKLGISKFGQSIFDGYFPDETFEVKHQNVGLIGYCKKGGLKYTNECQFYVTTGAPLSFMDGKYVVFGRIIQGMRAFRQMEKLDCLNERPKDKIEISKCGSYFIGDKKTKA